MPAEIDFQMFIFEFVINFVWFWNAQQLFLDWYEIAMEKKLKSAKNRAKYLTCIVVENG